jgi:hypothetical protein
MASKKQDAKRRQARFVFEYHSGFTNLSSIAHSDLGCWVYEKTKPSTPRSEH